MIIWWYVKLLGLKKVHCKQFGPLQKVTISNFFGETNPESPFWHQNKIKKKQKDLSKSDRKCKRIQVSFTYKNRLQWLQETCNFFCKVTWNSLVITTVSSKNSFLGFFIIFFCWCRGWFCTRFTDKNHLQWLLMRQVFFIFIYLFSFLLTINLKLIKVHVEIKIVNKEAATKRSTLLHAQCQLCMVAVPLNKAMWC